MGEAGLGNKQDMTHRRGRKDDTNSQVDFLAVARMGFIHGASKDLWCQIPWSPTQLWGERAEDRGDATSPAEH